MSTRQNFIQENKYLNYYAIEKELNNYEYSQAFVAQLSQQVLKQPIKTGVSAFTN